MFVSYAQNQEDVVLWRVLGDVDRGAFVDIGAWSPTLDSVSRAFSERGWRGVHVEPIASYAAQLRAAYPDDLVLEVAVGAEAGTLAFHDIPDTGLGTGDPEIAERHRAAGFEVVTRDVPVLPLSAVFARLGPRDIHWLKIDVEGMEKAVIDGWEPSVARPWIVVVESTEPNSTRSTHALWEAGLCALGYEFALFDGLNRFYVHENHADLAERLTSGACVFDSFVLSNASPRVAPQIRRIMELERALAEAQASKGVVANADDAAQPS